MIDRRLYPCNGRVAHKSLAEVEDDVILTDGVLKSITVPVADLLGNIGGALERQLLFGDGFLVLEEDTSSGYAFGQASGGAYVGYVRCDNLEICSTATHRVSTLGAHVYGVADIKSTPLMHLPFTAFVAADYDAGNFLQLKPSGYVAKQQVVPLKQVDRDPAATAERLLGTPYLWGGDSNFGLDCSGLIHICLRAAGRDCPRDSDLQAMHLGKVLDAEKLSQRGDLIFWDGHVGMMLDGDNVIHANAHLMAVTSENLGTVCERIQDAEGGPILCRRRL